MKLCIIVPCYNEEAVIHEAADRLIRVLSDLKGKNKISSESQICFVDDGSSDLTWSIIEDLSSKWKDIHGIKLSCNRGHQNALVAGLLSVDGDAVVTIDADLQDDIQMIEKMVDAFEDGHDIVYGIRASRKSDSFFKRFTAESYYRILHLMGVKVLYNHADFRLMSKRALEALAQYKETNIFLRGIIPNLGFPSTTVSYAREKRLAGETKYPLTQMLSFAANGITSFSVVPLRGSSLFRVGSRGCGLP